MSMFDNRKNARHLCECGCRNFVKYPDSRFVRGHWWKGRHHTKESTAKMKKNHKGGMEGKHHSKKAKRKISKAKKGITKEINPNLIHSKETIRKISETHKGHLNPNYGKHLSESTKKKMSAKTKGVPKPKSMREKVRKAQIKLWQNPTHKRKQIKAMCNGIAKAKPTKPERRLRNRLNKLFPGEYKFTGDGSFIIGNKKPDFININSQKKIIELFGDYWHGKKVTGRTKKQEENQRIKHFNKYGYKTLIIWQYELKNIPKLKRKLKVFNEI